MRSCCGIRLSRKGAKNNAARVECPHVRRDARVAEGGALLRRYTGLNPYRGFESLSLRQLLLAFVIAGAAAGYAWSEQARAPGEYVVTLAAPAEVKAIADVYGRFGIRGIE